MPLNIVEYSDEVKQKAVEFYAFTGSIKETAQAIGVSANTVSAWKHREWFIEKLRELNKEKERTISAKFDRLIEKAQEVVDDRLDNGEEVVTKTGEKVKKQISARDAASILGIVTDKRNQMEKKGLSDTTDATIQQQLSLIAAEFLKYTKARDVTPTSEEQNAVE